MTTERPRTKVSPWSKKQRRDPANAPTLPNEPRRLACLVGVSVPKLSAIDEQERRYA